MISVLTTSDQIIKIADDPANFKVETNIEPQIPFPGWVRITCENGDLLWFNAAHIVAIGNLTEEMELHRVQEAGKLPGMNS